MEPRPKSRTGFRASLRRGAGLGGVLLGLLGGTNFGNGAEPHWAFQPIRDTAPPSVKDSAWCRTSLDRFILARLEESGRRPVPEADRRTLIRRLAYDLTGLPPSAVEVDAFERDPSSDAYERLVDRLLASPRYGEHWGRRWLDVVRYADTAGETADYPVPTAWRYRNYVVDALNADMPYDRFLREQVAGDILAREQPADGYARKVAATGFIAISRRFGFDSENYHHLTVQDTIDTVGQTVLGLTLGCARCHPHKYDPVSSADYYGLYGIFESTRYSFPGSEQKQRHRALVPMVPPSESRAAWQVHEERLAALAARLEALGKSGPGGTLRSLDETDGDFEMQAPAAGGSKGVLVPPWVYDGPIAVAGDAQSPFRNVHPSGKVGASVPAGTNAYRLGQALLAAPADGSATLHGNLDFRFAAVDAAKSSPASHRFWIGESPEHPRVSVELTSHKALLRTAAGTFPIRDLKPGEWQSLRVSADPKAGTVSGHLGNPGDDVAFGPFPLGPEAGAPRLLEFGLAAIPATGESIDAIAFDHLEVRDRPFAPVSRTARSFPDLAARPDPAATRRELATLTEDDGGFELGTDGEPPSAPWNPGPNAAVRIQASAQSPFTDVAPVGERGLHLGNLGLYDGFGRTLPKLWTAETATEIHVGFDFRATDMAAGGDGTWRFHIGHGPGPSPAVELFFNGREFFRRSGDARDAVGPIAVGTWYQVRVALDLKARTWRGTLTAFPAGGERRFDGRFAEGWDGRIDYTFIDSYGHRGGVRPAIDVDNFFVRPTPLPSVTTVAAAESAGVREERRHKVAALRGRMADFDREATEMRQEMERLLVDGPFPMAYAVTEGTPRDARIQLRGEPDRPGGTTPRSLLPAAGGGALQEGLRGSGRRELAEWLASSANPLTARVMANRLWLGHFGTGLVRTPNDFGTRGQRPSHPELLDHLATEFRRNGWSMKALHRLIVNSATYRQRSAATSGSEAAPSPSSGPECPACAPAGQESAPTFVAVAAAETFSPFPRRRLTAEEVRDALLLTAGRLDESPGTGHPFPSPTTWGYTQHGPYLGQYEHTRRSLYLMTQRIRRHGFLALFDGADPNGSTPERRTSTVPTQALFFLNDPFVHDNAAALAGRIHVADGDPLVGLFRAVLGRDPTDDEARRAAAFMDGYRRRLAAGTPEPAREALAAWARVLYGANEFLTVD
jgi:hypothetical protein